MNFQLIDRSIIDECHFQYHWINGQEELRLTDTSGVQIFFQDANLRQYDITTTRGTSLCKEV